MLLLPLPRQTYVWCTIIVRWKHSFYGHCTLQVATHLKIVSQDWHVKRPFVLRCAFNPSVMLRSATGAMTGKTRSTCTITKHIRPVVTEAWSHCFKVEYMSMCIMSLISECTCTKVMVYISLVRLLIKGVDCWSITLCPL